MNLPPFMPPFEQPPVVTPLQARRRLLEAHRAMKKASKARRRLEPGSSRASVTTANARWHSAAEDWDRVFQWACDHGFTDLALSVAKGDADHD